MGMGLNEPPMKQTQTKKIKPGARNLSAKLKTARGRKLSSTRWLKRQINDPYVLEAKRVGYRSRSAWKLAQLDDRLKFLKKTNRILDLGAAPGGWTQVVLERAVYTEKVVAVDISDMIPMSSPTTGHKHTDHYRTKALCQIAFDVANAVLDEGGTLVVKVFQGGTENILLEKLKNSFSSVKHVKPPASRKESRETYLVALGFRF